MILGKGMYRCGFPIQKNGNMNLFNNICDWIVLILCKSLLYKDLQKKETTIYITCLVSLIPITRGESLYGR